MATHIASILSGCLLGFASNAIAHPEAQTTDRTSTTATAADASSAAAPNEAPSYDSDYAASMRRQGYVDNTPEADARPGEYYFQQGAYAFAKKDYRFAIQMYEVAASWAYKPAEFNLGVIYARGQGIPVDLPRAMAWMALAAERDEKRYVDARDAVYASMSKEQFEQANSIWRDLKKTYGDQVALRRAKARWQEVRTNVTGSHVGFVGHLDVGVQAPAMSDPSAPKGVPGVHRTATSSAEIFAGGNEVDGVTAYRQLRETNNPYDPKFERLPLGTATVEALIPVKPQAANPNDETRQR